MDGLWSLIFLVMAIVSMACWYLEAMEYDAPAAIRWAAWPAIIVLFVYSLRVGWLTWQLRELPDGAAPSYLTAALIMAGFLAVYREPIFRVIDDTMQMRGR